MQFLLLAAIGCVGFLLVRWSWQRPLSTVVPLYAATVPVAGVLRLPVPLPAPFDTLSSLLGGVALIVTIVHLVRLRGAAVPTGASILWFAMLGWAGLSVLWSANPVASLRFCIVAASLVSLLVVVSISQTRERDLDVFRVAVILGGIAVGAYAISRVLGPGLPVHGVAERFSIGTGSDADPNILAASLLLPLALSLERIIVGGTRWWRPWMWRVGGVVGAVMVSTAIVLTGSRGGLLASLAMLVLLLATGVISATTRRATLQIVAGAVGVGLVAVLVVAVDPRAVSSLVPAGATDALARIGAEGTSGRAEIWGVGVEICRESCAFGVGIGAFPVAYDEAAPFSGVGRFVGQGRPAHNLYLQIAVELGVIGLSLFVAAMLAEWRRSRRITISQALATRPILLGLLVVNLSLSAIWFKYFWLALMYVHLVSSVARDGPAVSGRPTAPVVTLEGSRYPAPSTETSDLIRLSE